MKQVYLYVPKLEDLWFRQKCMSDPNTMNYNAGYDVSFEGYHYDTGCIDFPKDKWESWYDEKMTNPNFYYAYIRDIDNDEFIGYVNFNKNPNNLKASMGIVIHADYQGQGYMRNSVEKLLDVAKQNGVKILTDCVPDNRLAAHKIFKEYGFVIVKEFETLKFKQKENVLEIEKIL